MAERIVTALKQVNAEENYKNIIQQEKDGNYHSDIRGSKDLKKKWVS